MNKKIGKPNLGQRRENGKKSFCNNGKNNWINLYPNYDDNAKTLVTTIKL